MQAINLYMHIVGACQELANEGTTNKKGIRLLHYEPHGFGQSYGRTARGGAHSFPSSIRGTAMMERDGLVDT